MKWFYESGGQQQGPVSESEFDRLIADGRITPATLVWQEGMGDWKPLREVRPGAGALSTPGGGVPPLPGDAPAGSVACASCGRIFPPSDVIQIGGRPICPDCKPTVLLNLQQGAGLPTGPESARTGPAWEQRQQLGAVKGIWETFTGTLFRPNETFATMRRTGDLASPLWYYLITGTIGGIIGLATQYLLEQSGLMPGLQPQQNPGPLGLGVMGLSTAMSFLVAAVLLPILLAIGAFIGAGVMHVSLMICGGAKQPYETTFRVVNYLQGSLAFFQLVPFCGPLVGFFWGIVCMVIGFSRAHEITTGRAVCAVLLPLVLCCGLVFVIVLSVGGIIAAAQQGGAPGLPVAPTP